MLRHLWIVSLIACGSSPKPAVVAAPAPHAVPAPVDARPPPEKPAPPEPVRPPPPPPPPAPPVALVGAVEVKGKLVAATAQRLVDDAGPAFAACWTSRTDATKTQVAFGAWFDVDDKGALAHRVAKASDDGAATCITGVVEKLTLPAKKRGSVQVAVVLALPDAAPTVTPGAPNSMGELDKEVIVATVTKENARLLACYVAQLPAKPGIKGTVSSQFFITPNGNVSAATGSGVDMDVANCVADVVKRIVFPKPGDGGGVQVNFPFVFKPGA
jgi:hypothetical protein